MKNFVKILALIALATSQLSASTLDDSQTVETVGVFVRGLKICHQDEWRHLSVNLEYEAALGGNAMDIQKVKTFIREFLEEYSNPADFWEVMNTKLVNSLAEAFPDIKSMESILSLDPDRTLHFPRASIVKYEQNADALMESFSFTKLNYYICQETFQRIDFHVLWEMKDNPSQWDYPDYLWIDKAMEDFFAEHKVSFSKWKELKPKLENHLLEKFSTLKSIVVEVATIE